MKLLFYQKYFTTENNIAQLDMNKFWYKAFC